VNRIRHIGLAIVLSLLTTVAVLGPRFVTGSHSIARLVGASAPPPMIDEMVVAPPTADQTDSTTDLYGNDINPAVAEYSIDPLGSPYEIHSPQTELPRLASPKS